MGMKLTDSETLPEGLKRIAREQLDDALAHLRGEAGDDDEERVHESRKSLKKARAVIRLVRKEVGSEVYERENERFRDIGRVLAPVRDAQVFVATLDDLVDSGVVGSAETRPLRQALERHRQQTRERVIDREDGFARAEAEIVEGRAMIDAWPIDRVDSDAFRKSLHKTYKRGCEAFGAAYEDPSPKRFHELRKRVKYLWYYSRFLKPAASDEIGALKTWTDAAGDALGLDHDLAELGRAAAEQPGVDAELLERLDRAIAQRRLELQWRALPLLRRIYSESPKSLSRRIAARFDAWRFELDPAPLIWLTPERADRVRELLARKENAESGDQEAIRAELRAAGIELSELAGYVAGAGAGFRAEHFDELVGRGLIRVGGPSDFGRPAPVDRLFSADVEIGPNEASGICPIDSEKALSAKDWDLGFWVVLDEAAVEDAIIAVGRCADGSGWQAERLPVAGNGHPPTDDGEDCVRIGEWIYVLGSHYGSKEGPLERERQYVARFREAQLGDGRVDLQVAQTEFRLHELINDALDAADLELFPLAPDTRGALVGDAAAGEREAAGELEDHLDYEQLPINIEGCAIRPDNGGVLLGLRFPTSADGHPLLVELDDLAALFEGGLPTAKGVWEVRGVGSRWVPAGVRGMADGEDGSIELLTGNLDSAGKGSVLIDAHPEAALARSAHFRLRLPGNRRGGTIEAEPVREFPGMMRVEGVAHDPVGRTFYVIDEEEQVDLRYSEPLPG